MVNNGCPVNVKKDLAMQNFIDVLRSLEIQQVRRMTDIKNVTSPLVYSLKYETTLQISRQTYQNKGKIPGQRIVSGPNN